MLCCSSLHFLHIAARFEVEQALQVLEMHLLLVPLDESPLLKKETSVLTVSHLRWSPAAHCS